MSEESKVLSVSLEQVISADPRIPSERLSPAPISKRKRDGGNSYVEAKRAPGRKKFKKTGVDQDESKHQNQGLIPGMAKLDSHLLADYVAQRSKRFAADASLIELVDMRIPETAILDTSEWENPRTLQNLPDFLRKYTTGNLASAPSKPGCPHTLVLASAGLRAADLTRALRAFQTKDATVAKLFAKHIKLGEAIEWVKRTRFGIGVGTPSRIIDLLDAGALSSSRLMRIIVDSSHIDQKKRGILDMRETQQPLMRLLNRPEVKIRYGIGDGGIELLFY